MTDEEFERIKAAEKDRLRAKQRFQETMDTLKRQNKVQSTVRRMRAAGADGLLVGSAIMDGDVRTNTEELTAVERTQETQ